jgi:hypothetical protein
VLLTRAPLYSWYCYHFLVRLACVRHAASVDSEPGSNSRLKLFVDPSLTEVRLEIDGACASLHESLRRRGCTQALLPCENDQAKPDHISRLACSTNLSKILAADRLSGAVLDRGPGLRRGVLELVCACQICSESSYRRFLREPFEVIELSSSSQSVLDRPKEENCPQKFRAAQNIKERPAKYPPEPIGLAGDELLGPAMACSL